MTPRSGLVNIRMTASLSRGSGPKYRDRMVSGVHLSCISRTPWASSSVMGRVTRSVPSTRRRGCACWVTLIGRGPLGGLFISDYPLSGFVRLRL
ncbi:hypothetical protein HerbRD11066_49900 [Herbidospora sp. RD11066]